MWETITNNHRRIKTVCGIVSLTLLLNGCFQKDADSQNHKQESGLQVAVVYDTGHLTIPLLNEWKVSSVAGHLIENTCLLDIEVYLDVRVITETERRFSKEDLLVNLRNGAEIFKLMEVFYPGDAAIGQKSNCYWFYYQKGSLDNVKTYISKVYLYEDEIVVLRYFIRPNEKAFCKEELAGVINIIDLGVSRGRG